MPKKLDNDIEYIQRNIFATDLVLLLKCLWNVAHEPLHKMIARK